MNSVSMTPTAAMMMPDSLAPSVPTGKSVEMAQQFESLILSQLLKQMRSTSEDGGMFPGDKSDTYGGMFDMYFGQFLAEKGGLGLTDFVTGQIENQGPVQTDGSGAAGEGAGTDVDGTDVDGTDVDGTDVDHETGQTGVE